jgi:hypothetical protein
MRVGVQGGRLAGFIGSGHGGADGIHDAVGLTIQWRIKTTDVPRRPWYGRECCSKPEWRVIKATQLAVSPPTVVSGRGGSASRAAEARSSLRPHPCPSQARLRVLPGVSRQQNQAPAQLHAWPTGLIHLGRVPFPGGGQDASPGKYGEFIADEVGYPKASPSLFGLVAFGAALASGSGQEVGRGTTGGVGWP